MTPAISVPTFVAKNASLFHGSRYPLNPKQITMKSNTAPLIQVISRGG